MNKQNLRPRVLTTEEASRIGKIGAQASAKARKERAIISSIYAKTLEKKIKVKIDGVDTTLSGEEVLMRRLQKIYVNGSDRAVIAIAKEIRETQEGQKISITNTINEPDYRDFTDEQRAALHEANEKLLEAGL